MEDLKKKAKLGVLGEIRGLASKLMQDGLSGKMQKVMVAAQDKEGLKEGLEKAKDVLDQMPKKDEELESEELLENSEEESSEESSHEEESLEEIEQQIKELQEKKLALMKKA